MLSFVCTTSFFSSNAAGTVWSVRSEVFRDAASTVHVVVADAATAVATSAVFANGGGSAAAGGAAVVAAAVAVIPYAAAWIVSSAAESVVSDVWNRRQVLLFGSQPGSPAGWSLHKEKEKKRKETKQKKKKACPVREKRWSSWKRNVSLLKCECNGAPMLRFRSLRRWCSRQASDRDRPCATLRISLNPVRSSIVQDLRLLPIDSSLVYLAVSEYISLSPCVFSGQVHVSSRGNQQEHIKQQEAAKPCQIGKIVCFLHSKMLPFKKFSWLRPEPQWGAQRPQHPTCKAPTFTAGYAPAVTLFSMICWKLIYHHRLQVLSKNVWQGEGSLPTGPTSKKLQSLKRT